MTASRFLGAAPAALLTLFLLLACRPGSAERPAANRAPAVPAEPKIQVLSTHNREITLDQDRVTVPVTVPTALPESVGGGERLGLYLEGVQGRGGSFEVYADLPKGVAPDPAGPYYVGMLSNFAPQGGEGSTVGYDITKLARTMDEQGKWDGTLDLTFVRLGLEGPGAPKATGTMRVKRVKVVRE
ncbi:MAG: hypothetical protein ACJ75H_22980 [Thermoanaerobaculia bacterium]